MSATQQLVLETTGKGDPRVRLVTPVGRAALTNLVKPRAAFKDQPPKFSVRLLLDPTDCQQVWQAICMVADAKWPASGSSPSGSQMIQQGQLHSPLRDGREVLASDAARKSPGKFDYYNGQFFINCGANVDHQPLVYDANNQRIDPKTIYPGSYARLFVNVFPFDQLKRGVSFYLHSVQFVRDGDRLSGFDPEAAATQAFAAQPLPSGATGQPPGFGFNPAGAPGGLGASSIPPGSSLAAPAYAPPAPPSQGPATYAAAGSGYGAAAYPPGYVAR